QAAAAARARPGACRAAAWPEAAELQLAGPGAQRRAARRAEAPQGPAASQAAAKGATTTSRPTATTRTPARSTAPSRPCSGRSTRRALAIGDLGLARQALGGSGLAKFLRGPSA